MASLTNKSANTASLSNKSAGSSNPSNEAANTASYTNPSATTSSLENFYISIGILLTQAWGEMETEAGGFLLLESEGSTSWSNVNAN